MRKKKQFVYVSKSKQIVSLLVLLEKEGFISSWVLYPNSIKVFFNYNKDGRPVIHKIFPYRSSYKKYAVKHTGLVNFLFHPGTWIFSSQVGNHTVTSLFVKNQGGRILCFVALFLIIMISLPVNSKLVVSKDTLCFFYIGFSFSIFKPHKFYLFNSKKQLSLLVKRSITINQPGYFLISKDIKMLEKISCFFKQNRLPPHSVTVSLSGVGFSVDFIPSENTLCFNLGSSHKYFKSVGDNFQVYLINKQSFRVFGLSLQDLNRFVEEIEKFHFPDCYKGKGVHLSTKCYFKK